MFFHNNSFRTVSPVIRVQSLPVTGDTKQPCATGNARIREVGGKGQRSVRWSQIYMPALRKSTGAERWHHTKHLSPLALLFTSVSSLHLRETIPVGKRRFRTFASGEENKCPWRWQKGRGFNKPLPFHMHTHRSASLRLIESFPLKSI